MKRVIGWMLLVAAQVQAAPPNIVLILADDLGHNDLGCTGSPYHETPHLDRLAAQSTRFTQAYAASPLCSPTRASILTGMNPARVGITVPECHLPRVVLEKGYAPAKGPVIEAQTVTRLDRKYTTLGEVFKQGGYATAHIGKWHLGAEPFSPLEHGFDIDIPHSNAPSPYHNGFLAPWPVWPGKGKPGEHLEDRMAEEAASFIHANKDRPFFLNFWLWSVHSPWEAKPEVVKEFEQKADPDKRHRHPVYAAMIKTMDDAVGRVLRAIDEAGIADHTLVVFMSDNGPWVIPNREASVMPPAYHHIPISDTHPLRGGKAEIFEGGVRVPLIVRFPGKVPAGKTSPAMVSSTDLYPTLLAAAGLKPPRGQATDAVNQWPVWQHKTNAVRDELLVHFPHDRGNRPGAVPSTSLRKGEWKLIRFYGTHSNPEPKEELYHLGKDPGEALDQRAHHPGTVAGLGGRMDALLAAMEAVVPKPNPDFGQLPATRPGMVIERRGEALFLSIDRTDPHIMFQLGPKGIPGPVDIEIDMQSGFGATGEVFWRGKSEGFAGERRVTFPVKTDGKRHTYQVSLTGTTGELVGLRLDPGPDAGQGMLYGLRLIRAFGEPVVLWPPKK